MLRTYVITLLICASALAVAAEPPIKADSKANLAALWRPILDILNQEPRPAAALPLPFSHALDVDLSKLYQSEIGDAKKTWRQQNASIAKKTRAEQRQAENEFLHQKAKSLNATTLAILSKAAASHKSLTLDYRAIASQVLREVAKNPVARLESTYNFQQGSEIGFCFGRALLTHYLLLKAGVPQSDLAKIFTMGDLLVERQLWRFHVAVLVRDAKNGFLVVDPLQDQPLAYQEWLAINKRYSVKKKLPRVRFYVTDPRKFLPSFGRYDADQLSHEVLRGYFDQLVQTLGEPARKKSTGSTL